MEGIPKADFEQLRSNLESVLLRIRGAEEQSARPQGAVRLVAVTKKVSPAIIRALAELGVRDFGENRPEDALRKQRILEAEGGLLQQPRWHMIGHYQRRKVRSTLPLFTWIHSVHDRKLLQTLEERSSEPEILGTREPLKILLQVNVSGEEAKQGFEPDALPEVLEQAKTLPHLSVRGLMTMAPFEATGDALRAVFARLRCLRDAHATPEQPLPELSMGMSRDFEEAILEGATLVRVGTGLFRGVSSLG